MVRAVATGRNIGNPEKGTECIIVKGVGGKEVLVLVVTSTSPEISDLLRLDVLVARKWRRGKGRSRYLQDRERGRVACKRLSDSWDGRNQRRKAQATDGAGQDRRQESF